MLKTLVKQDERRAGFNPPYSPSPRNEPSRPKPQISVFEKSQRRARQNLQTGTNLGDIAELRGDIAAEVTADLLKLSAHDKANGELINMRDKKGRAFTCPQALISANTRLDVNYDIRTARRHRKKIYEAFAAQIPDIKEFGLGVSFITPTFPNLLGVGFADNDRFQSLAWEKFLQSPVVHDFLYGGYSKTEWTLGNKAERARTERAFDLNLDGINYHSHALCINSKPFADGETSELENRLAAIRNKLAAIKKPNRKPFSDSHAERFYKLENRKILNSLRIVSEWTKCLKRAHRKIFGKPLKVKTNSGRVRFTFQNVGVEEIKAYDADEAKNGIFWEIAKTASYTAKGNAYNELPPELLLEAENVFRNKRIINPFGIFHKRAERNENAAHSLVNPPTQQAETTPPTEAKTLFDNALRGEYEPLKNYGIRLCSQGLRDTWLRYLAVNAELIIANRRDAMLERFPNAIFKDLSGKSYYGWCALKEKRQREKERQPNYDAASDNYHLFRAYQSHYVAEMMAIS
jgi:hypothetical protein